MTNNQIHQTLSPLSLLLVGCSNYFIVCSDGGVGIKYMDMENYRGFQINTTEPIKIYKNGIQQFSLRWVFDLKDAQIIIDNYLREKAFARLPNLNYPLPKVTDEDEQRELDQKIFEDKMNDHFERQLDEEK